MPREPRAARDELDLDGNPGLRGPGAQAGEPPGRLTSRGTQQGRLDHDVLRVVAGGDVDPGRGGVLADQRQRLAQVLEQLGAGRGVQRAVGRPDEADVRGRDQAAAQVNDLLAQPAPARALFVAEHRVPDLLDHVVQLVGGRADQAAHRWIGGHFRGPPQTQARAEGPLDDLVLQLREDAVPLDDGDLAPAALGIGRLRFASRLTPELLRDGLTHAPVGFVRVVFAAHHQSSSGSSG